MKNQITFRSILTGLVIGSVLTPCNVYSGLKIGWTFNMSILAVLLGYGFWKGAGQFSSANTWSIQENAYSQTTASAAASIISGGLVAPIPAYTMITGKTLPLPLLMFWVFVVSILGVLVAIGLRQQMLINEKLVFPSGVATAETLNDIHSCGKHARKKLFWLTATALFAFAHKIINDFVILIPKANLFFFIPSSFMHGVKVSAKKLGFFFDPSFLMFGFGIIMGIRSGLSLFIGATLCWGALAPFIIYKQWVVIDTEAEYFFGQMVTWTLWPGVGLMVASSLTSFAISLSKQIRKFLKQGSDGKKSIFFHPWFIFSLAMATVLLAIIQQQLFNIPILMGALAVVSSILLGVVSSRVSGETGIPPIGALGKVTQLAFGLLNPGQITSNLMTANVTGGAAGQSSDLLHDLKAGLILKIHHHQQIIAQCFGICAGAIIGSLAYTYMIPDPSSQLLTTEWPAPAVATWKSVAELMAKGVDSFPAGAKSALIIGSIVGVITAILEKVLPKKLSFWIPSSAAMGLAFVIPASTSLTMFLGALFAYALKKYRPSFAHLFLLVIAAGFVTGESLAGVLSAILN